MRRLQLARNVRLGVKNLTLHALRSLLTMLGVILGVGSVIAMLAIGEGASREAMDQLRKLGSNNILISSKKPVEELGSATGGGRRMLSIYGLLYEDEARIRTTIPGVRRTVPAKTVRKTGELEDVSMELRVVGTTSDWFELVKRPVVAGRVLTPRDLEDFGSVVVLTESGARKLLATSAVIGQALRIGGQAFEVAGIIQSAGGGSDQSTPDKDIDAYVPINLARERFTDLDVRRDSGSMTRERVELHQLIVEVESTDRVMEVAQAVKAMFARFHAKEDYQVVVPLDLLQQAERTREIGIRRAIGARREQIVLQFLIETVVLSTLGGCVGVGLGIAFPWLVTHFSGIPTQVTGWSLMLSVGISLMVGVLFGIYPALRAAMLDPIVALRHE